MAAGFGKIDGKWQPADLKVALENQSKHNEKECLLKSRAVGSLSVLERVGRNWDT